MKFVLGTSSKWRKDVITEHLPGLVWRAASPDIDEKAVRDPNAEVLCMKVAEAKAEALKDVMNGWVDDAGKGGIVLLTADQVVRHGDEIREKPESAEENYRYLKSYSIDEPLETCSALVLTHFPSLKQVKGIDIVRVAFNPIPDSKIHELIAQGNTLQCCGGFTIEDLSPYIHSMSGEVSSVQGLPITLLKKLLLEIGYPLSEDA